MIMKIINVKNKLRIFALTDFSLMRLTEISNIYNPNNNNPSGRETAAREMNSDGSKLNFPD